jgi:hypothetical protein
MTGVDDVGRLAKVTRLARNALDELFDQRRPFGRLAAVHTLQAAGSTFITVSLAGSLFFSITPKAAESKVLLYLVLTIAPFAIVGPALSPLLDRGRQARRASVAVATGGSAVLCLAMARDIHSLLLFPEAFGILVLAKLYLVARASLVPVMAEPSDDLAIANSKLAVLASAAGFLILPIAVGVLHIGPQWVLILGAIVFLAGTVAAFRLPRVDSVTVAPVPETRPDEFDAPVEMPMFDVDAMPQRSARPPDAAARHATNGPQRIIEFAEARRRIRARIYPRNVLIAIGAMSVARATVGFVEFFLAFALKREHAATWWYGMLLVASGAGSLVGSMAVPYLRRYLTEQRIIVAALVSIAVGAVGAMVLRGLWAQALLTLVVGVGPTSAKAALDSIVQRHVAPAQLGRAFGRLETRLQLTWVLAALLAVLIHFPLVWGDFTIAVVCAAAAIVTASSLWSRSPRLRPAT